MTVCWSLQVTLNCSGTKRGGVSNRKQLAMKVKRTNLTLASFPGLHTQLFLLAVQKAEGRPGTIYQVRDGIVYIPGLSLVPRPPHPAFVPCSMKSGGKPWKDFSHDACCWHTHIDYIIFKTTWGRYTKLPWKMDGKKGEVQQTGYKNGIAGFRDFTLDRMAWRDNCSNCFRLSAPWQI